MNEGLIEWMRRLTEEGARANAEVFNEDELTSDMRMGLCLLSGFIPEINLDGFSFRAGFPGIYGFMRISSDQPWTVVRRSI